PLLADMGVAAALDAQARKAPIAVSVEADGVGRYPQEIEAAVYFCALEALRSAAGAPGTGGGGPGLNGGAPGLSGGAPGTDGGAPGTDGSGPGADRRLDVADGG